MRNRAVLVRTALDLWAKNGYDETSVARICSEAGVSKGLFYFYFARKEDLLVGMASETGRRLHTEATRLLAEDYELDTLLAELFGGLASRIQRTPRLVLERTMIELYRREGAQESESVDSERGGVFREVVEEVLLHAIANGKLDPAVDPRLLSRVVATFTYESVRLWASGQLGRRSLKDELLESTALMVRGARSMASEAR